MSHFKSNKIWSIYLEKFGFAVSILQLLARKLQKRKSEFLIFWYKIFGGHLRFKCSLLLLKQDSSMLALSTFTITYWLIFRSFISCSRFLSDLSITLEKPLLTSWSLSCSLTHLASFLTSFIVLTPLTKSFVLVWITNPAGMDASQMHLWDVSYGVSETSQRGLVCKSLRRLPGDWLKRSPQKHLRDLSGFLKDVFELHLRL